MKANNDPVLSATELGGRWGVTARHVSELARKGISVRAPSGGYYERASTLRYIESLRKTAAGRTGISDERLRLVKEQADKVAFENAVAREKYWLRTEAKECFFACLQRLRGHMLAVKDRIQMRLGHLSKRDIHEIEQEIILAITEAAIEEFGPIPTDEQEGTT
jgi:phage terminase Nu1 subunit (DNA packaging protein)